MPFLGSVIYMESWTAKEGEDVWGEADGAYLLSLEDKQFRRLVLRNCGSFNTWYGGSGQIKEPLSLC